MMPQKKIYPRVRVWKEGQVWFACAFKDKVHTAHRPVAFETHAEALRIGVRQAERVKAIRKTRGFM